MQIPDSATMAFQWRELIRMLDIEEQVTPQAEFLFYAGAGAALAAMGNGTDTTIAEYGQMERLAATVEALNAEITRRTNELQGAIEC